MSTARAADLLALRTVPRMPRGTWAALDETRAHDADRRVRSAALTVIAQRGTRARATAALAASASDPDPTIRRRVSELAAERPTVALIPTLRNLLTDGDDRVAEAAAAALGEAPRARAELPATIAALSTAATNHGDALVREAAVAALGSIGDVRGLAAILAGCSDKPAIRRRAVLALAPFDGPEVDAALERARTDRDWQTRQAAELLEQ